MDQPKDELDSAMERAKQRGLEWKEKFKTKTADEQIEIVAGYLYEYVVGFEMGAPYFEELVDEQPEQRYPKHLSKNTYRRAARFVVSIFRD